MREPSLIFASGAFRITEGTDSFMHGNPRRRLTTGDIQVCILLMSRSLLTLIWVQFATIQYSNSESQIMNMLSTVLDDDDIPKGPNDYLLNVLVIDPANIIMITLMAVLGSTYGTLNAKIQNLVTLF